MGPEERKKALKERETASQNYLKARANNFNFLSQKVVETDPTTALRLAEYALRLDSANKDIFENLNRIYYDNNFYRIVTRHEREIFSVAFSPDGKSVLTGSADNTACLSDMEGNVMQVFKGHKTMVTSVAFSTDRKNLLTGSSDSTAQLWDLQGNLLQVFKGHENNISSVAFSPDGKTILTGSWDKTARLWNIKETLKEFQMVNAYQELSLTQMLKYGMVIYDDVLKLEDEKSIKEAADYYLNEINLVGKDKKNEYLNYALNLIDKLIIKFKNDSYSQKRDSLMRMQNSL